MANIERNLDNKLQPVVQTQTGSQEGLTPVMHTTPGVYYFDEGHKEIRRGIQEKIEQISQGKY